MTIATAAGFAAVFAFTFAIIQPVLGAMADMFGKARLMIVCLVLLGLANILGAMATSFPLLFATRILAGIGSGGVFPIALGLTSDLVGPEKRQIAIGRTLMGSMSGNLLGASFSGLIGDFMRAASLRVRRSGFSALFAHRGGQQGLRLPGCLGK